MRSSESPYTCGVITTAADASGNMEGAAFALEVPPPSPTPSPSAQSRRSLAVAHLPLDEREALRRRIDCWTRAGMWQENAIQSDDDDPYAENVTWVPSGGCPDAPLRPFSMPKLCALLNRRPVHMIGDSVVRDFLSSLLYWDSGWERGQHNHGHPPSAEELLAKGFRDDQVMCRGMPAGATHLYLLHTYSFHNNDNDGNSLSWYFNESVSRGIVPRIVLLNQGLHMRRDAFDRIHHALSSLLPAYPDTLFLWIATTTPHRHCHNYTRPVSSPLPQVWDDLWNWKLVDELNTQVQNAIRNDTFPGVLFVDIHSPMAFRPEIHPASGAGLSTRFGRTFPDGDCVHYTGTREYAIWRRLIYNVLAEVSVVLQA